MNDKEILLKVVEERDYCIDQFFKIYNSENWLSLPMNIQGIVIETLYTFSIEENNFKDETDDKSNTKLRKV